VPTRRRRLAHPMRLVPFAALLASGAGCVDYADGPGGPGYNTPAIGQTSGTFGFSVLARRWTADESYSADIPSPTLTVGLTITGYKGGAGTLAVLDAEGDTAFTRSLAGNVAQGSTVARGQSPFTVRVVTSNYTGTVALGVTGAN